MLRSIKHQFVIIFSAFVFVSCALITVLSVKNVLAVGEFCSRSQAEPIVVRALDLIDGDEFERIASELDEEDEVAEEIRLTLLNLAQSTGCKYLYTMIPASGSNYMYVIDGSCDPSDEENYSPMGTEDDITSWGNGPIDAYNKGIMSSSGFEKQENWGWQISVYAPIKNSSGRVVGIVGCDYDVAFVIDIIKNRVLVISIISLLFVIAGGTVVYLFSGYMFGALHRVSEAMYQISRGSADLTQRISEQNTLEIGSLAKNCNLVINRLADLVRKLQNESKNLKETSDGLVERMQTHIQNINYASDGISEIDSFISSQTEKINSVQESNENFNKHIANMNEKIIAQAEAVEQSSSAIEQISANIRSVSKNVISISGEYENLVNQAAEGNRIQQEVSDQIEQIAKQSQNLNEANTAISTIAEQTNLLAMNAAIEAAHAGELGKGFSVVADEIRALAETSATQSNAISSLLGGITEAIEGIVNSSQKSSEAFEIVGSKISEMESKMKEIEQGMNEETAGVNNILETVKVLDGTTSAITEASDLMKKESSNVVNQIQELKVIADETRTKSSDVSNNMLDINVGAQEAFKASEKNEKAANHIVAMITGFKVE